MRDAEILARRTDVNGGFDRIAAHARTDARGHYAMKLDAGDYELRVSHGAEVTVSERMSVASSGVHRASFRLAQGATVRGRVVDAEGGTLAGVPVWADDDLALGMERARRALASTNPQGEFELTGVFPGFVSVCASDAKREPACAQIPVPLGAVKEGVTLTIGGYGLPRAQHQASASAPDSAGAMVAEAPLREFYVWVRDDQGVPQAAVDIELNTPPRLRDTARLRRVARTDTNGLARFAAMVSGPHMVRVLRHGVAMNWSLPAHRKEPDAPQTIDVSPEPSSVRELTLEPCDGFVTGRVETPSASKGPIWIEASPEASGGSPVPDGVSQGTIVQRDGTFRIDALCHGAHSLRAVALDTLDEAFVRGQRSGARVPMRLSPRVEVTGEVRSEGESVQTFAFLVRGPDGTFPGTGARGSFRFWGIAHEAYRVSVEAEEGLGETFTTPSAKESNQDVSLTPWASVRGRVLDERGNAVSGAIVAGTRVSDIGGLPIHFGERGTITDGDGTFELEKMGPGEWLFSFKAGDRMLFVEATRSRGRTAQGNHADLDGARATTRVQVPAGEMAELGDLVTRTAGP